MTTALGGPELIGYHRQRDGWTHGDLLRLSHPKPVDADPDADSKRHLFDWILGRDADLSGLILIEAFEELQKANSVSQVSEIVSSNPGVSWEMIPDQFLNERAVWNALLHNGLPQTALMRQLPRLTRMGLLDPLAEWTPVVARQLADPARLMKGRVHPVNVLVAQRTYASGQSARGDGTWTPSRPIVDALDQAFYAAYGAVQPTGKRLMLALDVSGSMTQAVSGLPLTCREASAALALVTAATESAYEIVGFTSTTGRQATWGNLHTHTGLSPLSISPRQRLDDAIRTVSDLPFGGTDCSLPMVHALKAGLQVDAFIVYTDNETYAGQVHPHQALEEYRQKTGIDARLIVVAMTANGSTIADPSDPGMLDVSGFDSAVPGVISDFARGL